MTQFRHWLGPLGLFLAVNEQGDRDIDELQSLLHPAPPHAPPAAQRFYRLTRPSNF